MIGRGQLGRERGIILISAHTAPSLHLRCRNICFKCDHEIKRKRFTEDKKTFYQRIEMKGEGDYPAICSHSTFAARHECKSVQRFTEDESKMVRGIIYIHIYKDIISSRSILRGVTNPERYLSNGREYTKHGVKKEKEEGWLPSPNLTTKPLFSELSH